MTTTTKSLPRVGSSNFHEVEDVRIEKQKHGFTIEIYIPAKDARFDICIFADDAAVTRLLRQCLVSE